jgi:DNA-binding XRE family transcriptional regulator
MTCKFKDNYKSSDGEEYGWHCTLNPANHFTVAAGMRCNYFEAMEKFAGLCKTDEGKLVAIGENGVVESEDGGVSWTTPDTGTPCTLEMDKDAHEATTPRPESFTGDDLKAWRLMVGLTQEELGKKLGIHPSTVSKYELKPSTFVSEYIKSKILSYVDKTTDSNL